MTRRGFLVTGLAAIPGLAALAATAAPRQGASGVVDAVEPKEKPETPGTTIPPVPEIPPAPGRADYEARLGAVREELGSRAEALVLPPGPEMRYLTGLTLERQERLVAYFIPREGATVLICSDRQEDAARSAPVEFGSVQSWEEDEDPDAMIQKVLRKAGVSKATIALGGTLHYDEMARLNIRLPDLRFISATAIVGFLRERKSAQEIAIIRAAGLMAERAIALGWRDVREGMTERELAAVISAHIEDMGGIASGSVRFGEGTADRYSTSTDRRLSPGEPIVCDFGARVHGYWGRVARTGIHGAPSGRMNLIQDLIDSARERSIEAIKPGIAASAIYYKARAALSSRGLAKYVPARLGQGVGLEISEPPYLSPAGVEDLASGNVTTFEPGVETPGEYGIRSGDLLEISPAGGRFLTATPPAIVKL